MKLPVLCTFWESNDWELASQTNPPEKIEVVEIWACGVEYRLPKRLQLGYQSNMKSEKSLCPTVLGLIQPPTTYYRVRKNGLQNIIKKGPGRASQSR